MQLGVAGEKAAGRYLESEGYRILERNFRCASGEIDIVAGTVDSVVFVEVKTWRSYGVEDLGHSVDRRKQSRIRRCAEYYLLRHPEYADRGVRFDLVFLSGDMRRVEHFQDAF